MGATDFGEDIRVYKLVNKRLTGATLKLFFENAEEKKVLELINIVSFIDKTHIGQDNFVLDARHGGSIYGWDVSVRLNRPEVKNFYDVFLHSKTEGEYSPFRALAEKVNWRDHDSQPDGDINY